MRGSIPRSIPSMNQCRICLGQDELLPREQRLRTNLVIGLVAGRFQGHSKKPIRCPTRSAAEGGVGNRGRVAVPRRRTDSEGRMCLSDTRPGKVGPHRSQSGLRLHQQNGHPRVLPQFLRRLLQPRPTSRSAVWGVRGFRLFPMPQHRFAGRLFLSQDLGMGRTALLQRVVNSARTTTATAVSTKRKSRFIP